MKFWRKPKLTGQQIAMPANGTEASAKAKLLRVDRATVYRDLQRAV
jgi:hypothetical protein